MTSVQNHRPLLSGNSIRILFVLIISAVSCGSLNTTRIGKNQPAESVPDKSGHGGGVVITSDKMEKAKTTTKVFRGISFEVEPAFKETYKIAVMLPFYLKNATKQQEAVRQVMLDYYEGVELALDELRKSGFNITLKVFDTKSDSTTVRNILKDKDLRDFHLFIGPVYDDEFALVEEYCAVYNIPLVNPLRFYKKKSATGVRVFSPVCADTSRFFHSSSILLEKFKGHRFIMLNDKTADGFILRKAYKSGFMHYGKKELPVLTLDELKAYTSDKTPIVILAPTNSENIINNLLNQNAGKKHVKIVGLEDWFELSIIHFSIWDKNNLYFMSHHFVDKEDITTKQMRQAFKEYYGSEPGRYAYIGYDQAGFFCEALCALGARFHYVIEGYQFPVIHNSFKFVDNGNFNYENVSLNFLELVDFKLVRK
jgi:ABC-type branched-subunit amino acid transport system substrate-binding protein